MNALAGTLSIGGATGLVLDDEPAATCYLPEHRAFLRWLAADSDDELRTEAERILADPVTLWEFRDQGRPRPRRRPGADDRVTTRLPPRATLESTGTDPAITGEPPEEQGPCPQRLSPQ
ncbi:Imm21 family immunity protein [Amycolatopsis japonica]|uniref:Imm21 family immunity protein n=1 Tax=Amycolatopsis japonica TaxID=208439 RepID=UPI00068F9F4B